MRSVTLLPVVLLLLLGSGCGDDADAPTRPRGLPGLDVLVVDEAKGEPREGIWVYCYRGRKELRSGETGPDGRHDFGLLDEGTYVVAAGRRDRGYLPQFEEVEVAGPTTRTIRLQSYDGFRVRLAVPEGIPSPRLVKVLYRKQGGTRAVTTQIPLNSTGLGRSMKIAPGEFEMEFRAKGFRPVTREITVPRKGTQPIVVEVIPE